MKQLNINRKQFIKFRQLLPFPNPLQDLKKKLKLQKNIIRTIKYNKTYKPLH